MSLLKPIFIKMVSHVSCFFSCKFPATITLLYQLVLSSYSICETIFFKPRNDFDRFFFVKHKTIKCTIEPILSEEILKSNDSLFIRNFCIIASLSFFRLDDSSCMSLIKVIFDTMTFAPLMNNFFVDLVLSKDIVNLFIRWLSLLSFSLSRILLNRKV